MQLRDSIPADTATGACLVTYRSSVDGPFVDLDLDLETLPPFGRIIISAQGVEMLMACLGWDRPADNTVETIRSLREENAGLKRSVNRLRVLAQQLFDAAELSS